MCVLVFFHATYHSCSDFTHGMMYIKTCRQFIFYRQLWKVSLAIALQITEHHTSLNTHLWTLQLKLKNKTLHNLFLTNKLHSWYFTVVSSNQNTKQVIKTNYWVSTSAALFISFLMCMPRIPEVHVIMQVMLIILSSEPVNRVRCNAVENLICWNGNGNQR